jgi:carboxyl-terminal processing protease
MFLYRMNAVPRRAFSRFTRWTLPALLVAFALAGALRSQSEGDGRDRAVLMQVARMLPEGHISRAPLDDRVSQRALDDYIEGLDPAKLYFSKADVENLGRYRDQLDDMMRAGDTAFAKAVMTLFQKRFEERVGWVHEILASDLGFDKDEYWVTDAKKADFAATSVEARDRWRRRVKYEILALEGPDLTREKAIEKLRARYDRTLARVKGMSEFERLSVFVNAVTTAYDPHTTWLSPRDLEDFEIAMRLNYEGIGAILKEEDGYVAISSLMPGGSAIKDGKLAPGDRILAVAQGNEAWKDVVGLPTSDVVNLIRGPVGTKVRLHVRPEKGGEPRVHVLVRQKLQLEDSAAHGEVFEAKDSEGKTFRVGVINLPDFYRDDEAAQAGTRNFRSASRDVARILADFRRQSVDGVVLDLRFNGGGSLTEAIEVTGLFIDSGPVVRVRNSRGIVRDHVDEDRGAAWSGPLVVVTSKLTASASEIVAGAIQDYRRGLVVGDPKTHGKGTVQTVMGLDRAPDRRDLGALKLTIQQFYRPGGLSTQLTGVIPDVVLPSVTSDLETGEDELHQAMPADRVSPARFVPHGEVDEAAVKVLDESSRKRRAASEYFKKLELNHALARKLREPGRVPLEEKAFKALRAEQEAAKIEDNLPTRGDRNQIVRDGYLDEVLSIAADLSDARAKIARLR